MKINFSYDPGTSVRHMTAFEMAGQIWSTYITDDVTLNFQVGVTKSSSLPKKVIGGALPAQMANVNYQNYRNKAVADAKSWVDQQTINNLDPSKNRAFFRHSTTNGIRTKQTSVNTLDMTRANAKALGLVNRHSAKLDGYILMSDLSGKGVSWDIGINRVQSDELDLVSTALHEIGHALGFISGVDNNEKLAGSNVSDQDFITATKRATPLDKFRFSRSSNGVSDLSYGSNLEEKYFSIDGGSTQNATFASGSNKSRRGDGFQASHWKNRTDTIGVMDPTLARGERPRISMRDLRALDVIGWDINGSPAQAETIQLDYRALYNQARSSLAQRIGKNTTWLNQNSSEAADLLAQVRVVDVVTMARDSQNYDLSWLNPAGGVSAWLNWANQQGGQSFWLNWWHELGGSGFWQNIDEVFEQQSFFSTLDDIEGLGGTSESEIDSLTGQISPQTAAVSGEGSAFAPVAQAVAVQEQVDAFVAVQDLITGYAGAANAGVANNLQSSDNRVASLSLGSSTVGNLLGGGDLTGLGQDQLQGSASLGDVFAVSDRLG